jgi:hypothetical protein
MRAETRTMMNGNLGPQQSAAPSLSLGFDASLAPLSALGLLLWLLGKGLAAAWASHVRSLQRAGRLPPQL